MRPVNVALLGACGWIGKCHPLGYRNAALLFPEKKVLPTIRWLVDADEKKARALQPIYGDARVSTDWREAIADPAVDLVDISLPDQLHYEVSMPAFGLGCAETFQEFVICQAELGFTSFDARLTGLEDFRHYGLPQVRQSDGIVSDCW